MKYSMYLKSKYLGEYDSQTLQFNSSFKNLSNDVVYFNVADMKYKLAYYFRDSIYSVTALEN